MSSICVHGLGYIGLPTAAMLATHGHKVYGYDTDRAHIAELRDGEVGLDEPGLETLVARAVESGRLRIVDEAPAAAYHMICVPTPFDEERREANLDYVADAARTVGAVLRAGDTVVLESTVPPGTTEGRVRRIVEDESGLTAGRDFGLAHCPETVLPGNVVAELRENDRIVGGIDDRSATAAAELYESFVDGEIRTAADPTTAEFVKLIQNTARDVEIALANEVARIAHDYGIDSREAISMANAHPRVEILDPGPGVGGHCLPIDPWFLGVGSDSLDLVPTARAVNDGMTGFVVELLEELLSGLDGKRVAVFGVAYKGNVGDTRMSPGLRLAQELQHGQKPATPATDGGTPDTPGVAIHDPHVVDPTLQLLDAEEAVKDAHGIVITADHDEFGALNPVRLRELMAEPNVIDTKGVVDPDQWRDAGFELRRV
ncbi:nucleotide sugar dehydrogenase [Halobellus marinus]|uniref:nucleotide sugar dehydrogenase n=1 Tax=Halobellus TaxID=1073986 RepID=UPI0028B1269E|nr:nucleotide sugar dehydrogenase [Halobellus sp. DFY28]